MASPRQDLEALLSLINQAAHDAIDQYQSTEFPSLDVPARLPQDDLPLKRALRILEGACFQLCTTLAPPDLVMFRVSSLSVSQRA